MGGLWCTLENSSRSAQYDNPSAINSGTLFDTLSIDAISIIVKRMTCPKQKNVDMVTLPGLAADDETMLDMAKKRERYRFLALLFSENSPLRAAAGTVFSRIDLCFPNPSTSMNSNWRSMSIGPEVFECEAKEMELGRTIFSACGPYVRSISISNVPKEERSAYNFVEQFKSHAFQYCRNVEEIWFYGYRAPLTKWGTASSFFREYAANLHTIGWNGEEDEKGFPDLQQCVSTRLLKAHKLNNATLVSLLTACRATLEELDISITPAGDCVEVIETIRNHCKQLSELHIGNLEEILDVVGRDRYSSLLCSYGSQLKYAKMDRLGHEDLVEVLNACTNLEVIVYWKYERSVDWRQAYALGPQMARLALNAELLYGNAYPRALEQCSNLRELDLSGDSDDGRLVLTDEMIANVFSPSRFPKLEHLTIGGFKANGPNMRLIASCTEHLKSAYFDALDLDLEVSAFDFIADSSTHLKIIMIDIIGFSEADRSVEFALESLSELVKIFRKCRSLWFEIPCPDTGEVKKEDLIQLCKFLPCRDVDVCVTIGDVNYHYPE